MYISDWGICTVLMLFCVIAAGWAVPQYAGLLAGIGLIAAFLTFVAVVTIKHQPRINVRTEPELKAKSAKAIGVLTGILVIATLVLIGLAIGWAWLLNH
jgi:hypothetical protein